MGELYTECIVKKKTPAWAPFAKLGMVLLTIVMFLSSAIFWFMVIAGALFGYLTYRMFLNWDLEYEYIYVKGELDIDKIMGKAKRKRCITLDLQHTEIVAPEGSHYLDSYKNKKCKELDFSSHIPENKKYVMYATCKNEMVRVVFEPVEKMIKDMQGIAPRKVFIK